MVHVNVVIQVVDPLAPHCGTVVVKKEGAEMGKFLKILLVLAIAIGIGLGVSKLVEQKQRFMAMSEDEQRAFLADKIGDKVPEEKLVEIQNAVVGAMNGRRA